MQCTNRNFYRTQKIFRSRTDRVFAGVCGGLAEHFDVSSTWLRIGFIVGSIIFSPFVPILYFICLFIMPREGTTIIPKVPKRKRTARSRTDYPNRQAAMEDLNDQFDLIESKIRKMEDYVTSKEYVLKRKFEDL